MQITIQQIHLTLRRSRAALRAFLPWATLIVLAASAAAPGPWAARAAEPEITARVNGQPVTRAELQRVLADPLARRLLEQKLGVKDPDSRELDRLALQNLIHRRLLLQEADRRKFTVRDQELDQALTALRSRFTDLQSLGVWMEERGLDDRSLLDTVRAQVLMSRVWAALVKEVRPNEKEVQDYYEAHEEDLIIGEEVRLRIIAVQSSAAAQEILVALRKGENFGRLARQRSLGTLASKGGDTGWVDPLTLQQPLRQAVARLSEGEASRPLQTGDDEFLIVGLQERRPLQAKSLDAARPEIEQRLLAAKQQEFFETWLAEQEKKSKIKVLL